MPIQKGKKYLSDSDIFEIAQDLASDTTQAEIAKSLNVERQSVWEMLQGNSNMIKLAIRYIESRGIKIEHNDAGPVRYFKRI